MQEGTPTEPYETVLIRPDLVSEISGFKVSVIYMHSMNKIIAVTKDMHYVATQADNLHLGLLRHSHRRYSIGLEVWNARHLIETPRSTRSTFTLLKRSFVSDWEHRHRWFRTTPVGFGWLYLRAFAFILLRPRLWGFEVE